MIFPARTTRPGTLACAVAAALSLGAIGVASAAQGNIATDSPSATRPSLDTSTAIVQLNGAPLATYSKTKPAKGKKIDFNNSAVKSYRAQLSALRNDYKQWLQANVPGAKITGQYDIALNAVTVQLNGASLQQVSATGMVVSAEY